MNIHTHMSYYEPSITLESGQSTETHIEEFRRGRQYKFTDIIESHIVEKNLVC